MSQKPFKSAVESINCNTNCNPVIPEQNDSDLLHQSLRSLSCRAVSHISCLPGFLHADVEPTLASLYKENWIRNIHDTTFSRGLKKQTPAELPGITPTTALLLWATKMTAASPTIWETLEQPDLCTHHLCHIHTCNTNASYSEVFPTRMPF